MALVEVEYLGVQIHGPEHDPAILLKWRERDRYVFIWIGAGEASELVLRDRGVEPDRPSSHDVLLEVLAESGDSVSAVEITGYRLGVFYGNVLLNSEASVDARPSDAICIARAAEAPILMDQAVLEQASIALPEAYVPGGVDEGEGHREEEQASVDEFLRFLDDIDADDFSSDDGGAGDADGEPGGGRQSDS